MTDYLSAEEAARRLGVSRQTLYAYVSRGLLRAHEDVDSRRRRYEADAITRLAADRKRGRRPREVAKAALDWGLPVLESAITLIRDGRLSYRGRDAMALAGHASLEDVAAILWRLPERTGFGAMAPAVAGPFSIPLAPPLAAPQNGFQDGLLSDSLGRPDLLPLFAAATSDDPTAAWQTDRTRLAAGCGALVRCLVACVAGTPGGTAPAHRHLAAAWSLDAEATELTRMALVLCADHELNASSFTARCVASTGASARAAVIGGLAALSGGRHGGMTARIEAWWRGLEGGDPMDQVRRRLAAGETLPGFGHPLYPEGDTRAALLLARILPRFPEARALVTAVAALTGQTPNIDFALVTLRRFARLPEGAAFGLFALGRSVGWIAHALEQRETGQLIRPRAIYTGPLPAG